MPGRSFKKNALLLSMSENTQKNVLSEIGVDEATSKLVLEISKKVTDLRTKSPQAAEAFGFGCGGVTC